MCLYLSGIAWFASCNTELETLAIRTKSSDVSKIDVVHSKWHADMLSAGHTTGSRIHVSENSRPALNTVDSLKTNRDRGAVEVGAAV